MKLRPIVVSDRQKYIIKIKFENFTPRTVLKLLQKDRNLRILSHEISTAVGVDVSHMSHCYYLLPTALHFTRKDQLSASGQVGRRAGGQATTTVPVALLDTMEMTHA